MVRKIIVLASMCLINSCAAQEKTTNKKLLVYDNYANKKELLPVSLESYRLKNIVLRKKDTLKIDMSSVKGISLNKEDKLFHFLCEQDIISGWLQLKDEPDSLMTKDSGMIYAKRSKEEIIESLKSTITNLRLIGNIEIIKGITTTLFQIDEIFEEEGFIIKRLYLLNKRNQELLSIAKIADYMVGDGESNSYTTQQKERVFNHYNNFNTDDTIVEGKDFAKEASKKVKFSITKDGKIQLLD